MELVDLVDSKSSALGRVGSNPTCGTTSIIERKMSKAQTTSRFVSIFVSI